LKKENIAAELDSAAGRALHEKIYKKELVYDSACNDVHGRVVPAVVSVNSGLVE